MNYLALSFKWQNYLRRVTAEVTVVTAQMAQVQLSAKEKERGSSPASKEEAIDRVRTGSEQCSTRVLLQHDASKNQPGWVSLTLRNEDLAASTQVRVCLPAIPCLLAL